MTGIRVWAACALLAAAGCAREPVIPATRLSDRQFIAVVSKLGIAQPDQRPAILEQHGTNETEIRAFITAHARDPRTLASAFDSIQRRIEEVRASGP